MITEAKRKVLEMVQRFELSVVTIGNGTACREAESFFAELIGNELRDKGVSFVIVNEAGASVYSTSRIGREEFPHYDASLRGAISIGRRLQDLLAAVFRAGSAVGERFSHIHPYCVSWAGQHVSPVTV